VAGAFLVLLLAAWAAAPAEEWIRTIGSKSVELGWAALLIGTVALAPSPLIEHRGRSRFRLVGISACDVRRHRWCNRPLPAISSTTIWRVG
jgi:hypothetical protein